MQETEHKSRYGAKEWPHRSWAFLLYALSVSAEQTNPSAGLPAFLQDRAHLQQSEDLVYADCLKYASGAAKQLDGAAAGAYSGRSVRLAVKLHPVMLEEVGLERTG